MAYKIRVTVYYSNGATSISTLAQGTSELGFDVATIRKDLAVDISKNLPFVVGAMVYNPAFVMSVSIEEVN